MPSPRLLRLLRQPLTLQALHAPPRPSTISTASSLFQPNTPTRLSSSSSSSTNPFAAPHPSPPRLPPDQQAEFERLQRAAATVADRLAADPAPSSSPAPSSVSATGQNTADANSTTRQEEPTTGGVWRGAPPEFEGDRNPRTGEIGGPKNEPLRWGAGGDWSYNGRVTDF